MISMFSIFTKLWQCVISVKVCYKTYNHIPNDIVSAGVFAKKNIPNDRKFTQDSADLCRSKLLSLWEEIWIDKSLTIIMRQTLYYPLLTMIYFGRDKSQNEDTWFQEALKPLWDSLNFLHLKRWGHFSRLPAVLKSKVSPLNHFFTRSSF